MSQPQFAQKETEEGLDHIKSIGDALHDLVDTYREDNSACVISRALRELTLVYLVCNCPPNLVFDVANTFEDHNRFNIRNKENI